MINPSLFLRRAILGDAVVTGAMAVLLIAAAGFLGPLLNLRENFLREIGIFLVVYAALVGFLGTRELMPRHAGQGSEDGGVANPSPGDLIGHHGRTPVCKAVVVFQQVHHGHLRVRPL